MALLPLDNETCSLVWSTTPDHAKQLVQMDPADFVGELNEAFSAPAEQFQADHQADMRGLFPTELASGLSSAITNAGLHLQAAVQPGGGGGGGGAESMYKLPPLVGEVLEGSRASFPLGLSHVTNYVRPRVALAGDAAHKVHPLAGQGLNLGVGDAERLAEAIHESVALGIDAGNVHQLLPYERDRQRAVVPVMWATDVFKRLYSTSDPLVSAIRGFGMSSTNALAPLKQKIIQFAMG